MNIDEEAIKRAKQYRCGYDEIPEEYEGLWTVKMRNGIPLLSILKSGMAENKKTTSKEVIKESDARSQNGDEITRAIIKALSKQVQMKPILIRGNFYCSGCGFPITSEDAKGLQGVNGFNLFCNHCGQALEWRRRDD